MTNIPIMAFAGYSGSGKTTLLEKLIREIKSRGVRLAIIKHDGHQFEIDHEGKDSWRFTHAGADITVVTSADKTACVSLGECPLSNLLSGIHDVDLVLIEGFKNEKLPQIGVARRENGKGFTAPLEHFLAIITDMDVESPVPCFGYEDIPAIADFILEKTIMEKAKDFTHFNDEGRAKMVNVGEKPESRRTAIAAARVLVNRTTFDLIRSGGMKKGDQAYARYHPDVPPDPARRHRPLSSARCEPVQRGDRGHGLLRRAHRRGDGGTHSGIHGGADRIRYVQGRTKGYGDLRYPSAAQERRRPRRF